MFNSTSCHSQDYCTFISDYVSCIKVNGRHILPPLMTPERCMEMQKYKQLAIEVEKNLERTKLLNKHFKINSEDKQNDNIFYLEDSVDNETLNTCATQFFQTVETSLNHIPEQQNSKFDGSNLFCSENPELITSTHSTFIESDLNIYEGDVTLENTKMLSPNISSTNLDHCGAGDATVSEISEQPRLIRTNSYILETPSPLLLSFLENQRANLNSAPPKSANIDRSSKYSKNSSNENRRRSCWNLASAKEKWTSFENNIDFAFIPSKINTKNVKSKFNRTKSASLPASASPSPTKQLESKIVEPKINIRRKSFTNDSKTCKKSIVYKSHNSLETKQAVDKKSHIPTYETLQLRNYPKEFIEVNQEKKYELVLDSVEDYKMSESTQTRNEIIDDKALMIESKIKEIYQTLQTEHSKKMSELMIRQKKEQEVLIANFKRQQQLFIEQIRNNYLNISNSEHSFCTLSNNSTISPNCILNNTSPLPTVDNYLIVPESGSESEDMSSQTIHFQHDNNSTITTPDYCLNVESIISENSYADNGGDVNKIVRNMLNRNRGEQGNVYIQNNIPVRFHINNYTNISSFEACDFENVVRCNQELFSSISRNSNSIEMSSIVKIQAGIRGYLVRRLLRTERIQSLIQTLKDTLICALEFHSENIDNIQPADVELHKRLIQQLTAACFAIHDTFFKLSIKEKMAIISSDRQRIKEKMLRPLSAKNSPILSATTQKTLQRKLYRSNPSTPVLDENQTILRKSCSASGTSNTSNASLIKNDTFKIKREFSNKISKKPWR